jgi:hypothetical protein
MRVFCRKSDAEGVLRERAHDELAAFEIHSYFSLVCGHAHPFDTKGCYHALLTGSMEKKEVVMCFLNRISVE